MLYDIVKRGWEARLKLLGLSARKFCSMHEHISYNTWKQTKNPLIGWCDDVENAIRKLESGSQPNA